MYLVNYIIYGTPEFNSQYNYKLKDNDGCQQSEDVTLGKHFRILDGYIYWYNVFLSVPLSDFTSCFKNSGC